MGARCTTHSLERHDFGVHIGAAQLVAELSIASNFAANRAGSAANVTRRPFQAAASGDEGTDLAQLRVIERAWAAHAG
jgi:hypothetical protein